MNLNEAKEILENAGYLMERSVDCNESTEESTNRKIYRNYLNDGPMSWEEFGKLAFEALTENQIGLLLRRKIPHIKDDPRDGIRLRYNG